MVVRLPQVLVIQEAANVRQQALLDEVMAVNPLKAMLERPATQGNGGSHHLRPHGSLDASREARMAWANQPRAVR
eukprot:3655824-Prorocentrum_lima.AAC.1